MKKFFAVSLVLSALVSVNAQADISTSIQCKVDEYTVNLSENVSENPQMPLSIVEVLKNGVSVYKKFFTLQYMNDGSWEVWGYEGYQHQDGVVGVASLSQTEGRADLVIELPNGDVVDGSTVECTINR